MVNGKYEVRLIVCNIVNCQGHHFVIIITLGDCYWPLLDIARINACQVYMVSLLLWDIMTYNPWDLITYSHSNLYLRLNLYQTCCIEKPMQGSPPLSLLGIRALHDRYMPSKAPTHQPYTNPIPTILLIFRMKMCLHNFMHIFVPIGTEISCGLAYHDIHRTVHCSTLFQPISQT